MDTLISAPAVVKPALRTSTAIYRAMDRASWPETVPELTEAEAIKAARMLYRRFFWSYRLRERGQRIPKRGGSIRVKTTSGRRYTALRRGVIYVNPPRGWDALVHELSHVFHARLRPGDPGHGDNHRALEREMIEHVVASGWLAGRLKPKPKVAKLKPDPIVVEHERVRARIKAWETRAKRAATALAKLRKTERQLARRRDRAVTFTLG